MYYTWRDQEYHDFMVKLLYSLEPRYYRARDCILDEFDECLELMFLIKGKVVIGYETNKEKRYCVKYKDTLIIGDFGITFN